MLFSSALIGRNISYHGDEDELKPDLEFKLGFYVYLCSDQEPRESAGLGLVVRPRILIGRLLPLRGMMIQPE